MLHLSEWLPRSAATRRAALLFCGAVLLTAISLAAAPPARADGCAYVTGGQMYFCNPDFTANFGQQVTAHVGQRVCLCLMLRLSNGTIADIPTATVGPNTRYFSGGSPGTEGDFGTIGCFIPSAADANHQFPLYGIYHDTCKNVYWTFTVSLHVIP